MALKQRRASYRTNKQRQCHVNALPVSLIYNSSCKKTLQQALHILTVPGSEFCQPCRRQRKAAPHTPLIVAIKNRLRQIERAEVLDSIPDGHNSSMKPINPFIAKDLVFSCR